MHKELNLICPAGINPLGNLHFPVGTDEPNGEGPVKLPFLQPALESFPLPPELVDGFLAFSFHVVGDKSRAQGYGAQLVHTPARPLAGFNR